MRYAGIIKNDTAAAPGVCVSVFLQGCSKHCPGCHNPESWDYDGGKEFTADTIFEIITALIANGIHRNLCIMGGEPLDSHNSFLTLLIIEEVKQQLPDTKIYIWTGYTYNELLKSSNNHVKQCLKLADVLIDGPYIEAERDITLAMRGSRNQNIIDLKQIEKNDIIK